MALRLKTTDAHKRWWAERKIDWQTHYLSTWDHPHRQLIIWVLQGFPWVSLWEVGCGPGANLVRIAKEFKDKQLGGSDINADAIALAQKTFKGGRFHVEPLDNVLLSDNSVDVALADAALIYYGPRQIDRAVAEMVRISRNHLILCEFHSTSWWKRLLLRLTTGYNAYDYRKLLEKHGCHSIRVLPIPKEHWEGHPWQPFGHIIVANVTKI